MDCEVEEMHQPVNVPVDQDLYRLVKDYEYIWVRNLSSVDVSDLGEELYMPDQTIKKKIRSRLDRSGSKGTGIEFAEKSRICLFNRVLVPAGFTYDGASVPRLAWTITGIRPDGLLRAAAAVHDWFYRNRGNLPEGCHTFRINEMEWQSVIGRWNRKDCDRLFGRMMREAGVSPFKRKLAYLAVRALGGWSW